MIANLRKNKRHFNKSLFPAIFLLIIFSIIVVFLIIRNLNINKKRAELNIHIEYLKKEAQILEAKNKGLKEKIFFQGSKENLEKVAREKLDLKKQGEEVLVFLKQEPKTEKILNNNKEKGFWKKLLEKIRFW